MASPLRKAITTRYAVALYMSSVLGSGVLVLPGLAAQIAGPGSLLAWLILSMASYPMAYTFASLSARKAESGGIYSFARESFGPSVARAGAWLFLLWYVAGAPAVSLIAAFYLSFAFPILSAWVFLIAGFMILGVFLINYRGIVVSLKVQLAIIALIVGLLLITVAASSYLVRLENFSPLLPEGILRVGVAAALIFWSFLGYENVSNVAEEFKDPKRDFHRSIVISVLAISALYLSVSIVTVGTRAYTAGGSVAPFAAMLSNVLGTYGAAGTAILAVIIIFGTMNAYSAGMSRVIYASARERGFPNIFSRIHAKRGVPHLSLLLLATLSWISLVIFYLANLDLSTILLIPSGAAIILYVIGAASGIKLLREKGWKRVFPWISLAVSLAMLPFVGILLFVSLVVVALSLFYGRV